MTTGKKRSKKPPFDPRIIGAQERKEKALAAFERAYGKLRRAVKAMEKARKVIDNADRLIDRVTKELEG